MTSAVVYLAFVYLQAALPWGLVVSTIWGGDVDIRQVGSGNIGATNVARVYGWNLAGPVLVLDLLKGLLPVLAAMFMWPEWGIWWGGAVAAAAWIGHCFPIFLEFRGGKGVATGAGSMLALAPLPTLAAGVLWGALIAGSGRASVAALGAVVGLVGFAWWLQPEAMVIVFALAIATVGTHYTNILRIFRGEEKEVVRPVRWNRTGHDKTSPEQLLMEGPGGQDAGADMWRETIEDPLATDPGVPIE